MSARGHLNSLYKIKKNNKQCTCEDFIYNERKKIKRCNINTNNLEKRIIKGLNIPTYKKLDNIGFNEINTYLFIGTGGSYARSYFASKVLNILYVSSTFSMYPREVLYRNNNNIDKIILFSYSGTTSDIISSIQNFSKENIYLITKSSPEEINTKCNLLKENIFSYKSSINTTKERGFLSFEGLIMPSAIFLEYYLSKTNSDINIKDFIKDSINYWDKKLETILNKDIISQIKKHNLINIFTGDFTKAAVYDPESKIIESGILIVLYTKKRTFLTEDL